MDKGLADGNVTVVPSFEALAQLYHRGGHGIAQCDTTGLRGEWQEALEGSLQLEQIGNKEWEASMRAQRRKGVDEKPRRYAWDQEDFDQVDMTMGAAGEESREEGEGSGAIWRETECPPELEYQALWDQLREQTEGEARRRYA